MVLFFVSVVIRFKPTFPWYKFHPLKITVFETNCLKLTLPTILPDMRVRICSIIQKCFTFQCLPSFNCSFYYEICAQRWFSVRSQPQTWSVSTDCSVDERCYRDCGQLTSFLHSLFFYKFSLFSFQIHIDTVDKLEIEMETSLDHYGPIWCKFCEWLAAHRGQVRARPASLTDLWLSKKQKTLGVCFKFKLSRPDEKPK